jgi:hypothetical protein
MYVETQWSFSVNAASLSYDDGAYHAGMYGCEMKALIEGRLLRGTE